MSGRGGLIKENKRVVQAAFENNVGVREPRTGLIWGVETLVAEPDSCDRGYRAT